MASFSAQQQRLQPLIPRKKKKQRLEPQILRDIEHNRPVSARTPRFFSFLAAQVLWVLQPWRLEF
jgi:hypothetical protein